MSTSQVNSLDQQHELEIVSKFLSLVDKYNHPFSNFNPLEAGSVDDKYQQLDSVIQEQYVIESKLKDLFQNNCNKGFCYFCDIGNHNHTNVMDYKCLRRIIRKRTSSLRIPKVELKSFRDNINIDINCFLKPLLSEDPMKCLNKMFDERQMYVAGKNDISKSFLIDQDSSLYYDSFHPDV